MPKPPESLLREPRLHLVFEPDDDAEHADFVGRLADPHACRIVASASPAGRKYDWITLDIERSLGKDRQLAGAGRSTADRWARIHAWLIGSGAKTLIVSRIQQVDARHLAPVITLAVACDLDLWLITHHNPLPTDIAELLEEWPFEEVQMSEFRERWHDHANTAEEANKRGVEQPRYPRVPLDEFVLFRASCQELLAPEDFETVNRTFQAAALLVLSTIDGSRGSVTETEAAELVRDLVGPSRSLDEAITKIRAAQVAFFHRRYLLKVDLDRVTASYAIEEESRLEDEEVVARLASYAATRYPAAAAIALSTGASVAQIADLNIEDVQVEGDVMTLVPFGEIPAPAARLITPHLVHRILDGAGASDPLFVMHTTNLGRRDVRSAPPSIQTMLKRVLRDVDVRITSSRTYRATTGRSDDWRSRHGLSIQPLPSTVEAA